MRLFQSFKLVPVKSLFRKPELKLALTKKYVKLITPANAALAAA